MSEVFGRFIEATSVPGDSISLEFFPSDRAIEQRWMNARLSAEFAAGYIDNHFATHESMTPDSRATLCDSVNFVTNELVENALKYAYQPSIAGHRLTVQPNALGVRIYLSNCVGPDAIGGFRDFIGRLLSEEPAELYEQQLLRNETSGAPNQSGLGLIAMLDAHDATLAWRFEPSGEAKAGVLVTTMVSLHA